MKDQIVHVDTKKWCYKQEMHKLRKTLHHSSEDGFNDIDNNYSNW